MSDSLPAVRRELKCGCHVTKFGEFWRVTEMAFLCPNKHVAFQPLSEDEADDEPCCCPHERSGEIQCCFIQTGTCCRECVA